MSGRDCLKNEQKDIHGPWLGWLNRNNLKPTLEHIAGLLKGGLGEIKFRCLEVTFWLGKSLFLNAANNKLLPAIICYQKRWMPSKFVLTKEAIMQVSIESYLLSSILTNKDKNLFATKSFYCRISWPA